MKIKVIMKKELAEVEKIDKKYYLNGEEIKRNSFKLHIDEEARNNVVYMSEAQKSTWRNRGARLITMIEKCHLKEYVIDGEDGEFYCKFEDGRFYVNNNRIGFNGIEMKYWFNDQQTWQDFENFFANAYKMKLEAQMNR
jgi:hypothetical protein